MIHAIRYGNQQFSDYFSFSTNSMIDTLLSELGINRDIFEENQFYYDFQKDIHIARIDDSVFQISNIGLVAEQKITTNKYVSAFASQYFVVETLLNKADEICRQ